MKNRKKQFLKLGIILLAIAVTGTVAGIIQYKKANQFDLTVAEHVISKEEYLNCMKAVEYDTKIQIQQEYGAIYEDDFWKKQYDGKHGYEILADNTVEELKHIHAVTILQKNREISQTVVMKHWKNAGKMKMQSEVRK